MYFLGMANVQYSVKRTYHELWVAGQGSEGQLRVVGLRKVVKTCGSWVL